MKQSLVIAPRVHRLVQDKRGSTKQRARSGAKLGELPFLPLERSDRGVREQLFERRHVRV
ncbi:MAG TPA: hypothetical protein VK631_18190 [Solirubrobacteraceae bacterium]|nr:hypothetical protein [Solirubrobacteraceae bacterium]